MEGPIESERVVLPSCAVAFILQAYARWCSISVDGTLLCVSASASNASRNLFTYQHVQLPKLRRLRG